jgi:hypothetical protein
VAFIINSKMEREGRDRAPGAGSGFSKALDASLSKPFVKGLVCSDTNGLLIAGEGGMLVVAVVM